MAEKRVYLDYAATTKVDGKVLDKMLPYFSDVFGNADSRHFFGRNAVKAVDSARDIIAGALNASPSEIIFTSGGTESDNLAVLGLAEANGKKGDKVIISPVEHHAVLDLKDKLLRAGFTVEFMKVGEDGVVDTDHLESIVDERTVLTVCMAANNETGVIEPVEKIAEITHKHGGLFFTDAVQYFGLNKIDVKTIGADALSFSSHKIYGPKGAGALYVKNGVKINGIILGGQQERKIRGGTTNVPAIVGFAEAVRLIKENLEDGAKKTAALKDRFEKKVTCGLEGVKINGANAPRVPSVSSLAFCGVDGEALIFRLDLKGVAASNGSACSSGMTALSHVLTAMGKSEDDIKSTVRFSFGKYLTEEEVDFAAETVIEEVTALRQTAHPFLRTDGGKSEKDSGKDDGLKKI